jgi:1-acyl-sn-glycerol-3-phosphate acyltransferase
MSKLRSLLITAPLIFLATFCYGVIGVVVSFFDHTGDRQMLVARAWSRALLWISRVTVTVEGLENISPNGSYVLVSNHLSYMDTPVILANVPVQFRFLAKEGLFRIPLLGTHLARAGHIPVPLQDPRAAVRVMTKAAQVIKERGISLLIFPEGGRAADGVLQPFKEGAAYIAIKACAPLVPVTLIGTREVLPFGSAHLHGGNVMLRIGIPVPTSACKLSDRDRLTEAVRQDIAESITRTDTLNALVAEPRP